MLNENLEERIKSLKDKIADARDYISSDFCNRCTDMYKKIHQYESEIEELLQQLKQ